MSKMFIFYTCRLDTIQGARYHNKFHHHFSRINENVIAQSAIQINFYQYSVDASHDRSSNLKAINGSLSSPL